MLFARKSIGVEISTAGVVSVLLGGSATAPRLERVASRPLPPGTLRASLKEPNILDPEIFTARLRETHALLLHRGARVSVSLPDAVGRVLLLDVEGRFKSRSEALDIIRWKLKKQMPFDAADTHLDYQVLKVRESGDMALLVALVSRAVIGQYEELILAAGLTPARMELNQFALCRTFERQLALLEDGVLISFYDNTLGVMICSAGIPEFLRIKDLSGAAVLDSRVYMEINNTLLAFRERFPELFLRKAVCIAPPDAARDFCGMIAEATGIEPAMLEAKTCVTPSDAAPADQGSLFPCTAAIGAALRSL